MKEVAFLHPFFAKLENGRFIRSVVAGVLRLNVVLTVVLGAIFAVVLLRDAFRSEPVGATLGYLFMAAFCLIWTVLQMGVLLYRAGTISELPDSEYTVLPVVSILFRQTGESMLVTFALLGVGGCLFMWFSNLNPVYLFGAYGALMPRVSEGAGFVGGLTFLIWMLILAYGFIVACYFGAELIAVLPDIAISVKGLRGVPMIPALAVEQPSAIAPPRIHFNCSSCGTLLNLTAKFCGACGNPRPA